MIKSISVWAFEAERPLPEVFRMARDLGYPAVEVAGGEKGALTQQSTEADCRRVVEQAHEAGVQLASLASGLGWTYPLTSTDEATTQRGLEVTAHSLRLAQWLGVDAILLVPGGVGSEKTDGIRGTPYEVAYRNALSALKRLKPVAEECGVSIGIENVWNKFLLSPLEMRDFIDEVGSDRVGAYFDVGNVVINGYPEQWIRILDHRIKRIHFKDFKRSVGVISGFCDLLDGDVDYPEVMQALRDIGYDGFVTAEFFNCEGDLKKISEAMDKILEM